MGPLLSGASAVFFEAVSLIEKLMTQVSQRANLLTANKITAAFFQLLLAVGLICSLSVQPARAAGEVLGIAAIVNDAVISKYDLDQRVRLVVATSGLQPTRENIERIREQVLRSLVDEKLQMQEAERLELEVDDEEVDESITGIAQRAGMTSEEIVEYLDESGVNEAALRTQITADVAWNRVIGARFAPLVQIGDDEIDETLARINSDASQVQFQLAEIYLSFDNPSQEREMAQGAFPKCCSTIQPGSLCGKWRRYWMGVRKSVGTPDCGNGCAFGYRNRVQPNQIPEWLLYYAVALQTAGPWT